jgi:hypothetical protein
MKEYSRAITLDTNFKKLPSLDKYGNLDPIRFEIE